MNSSDKTLKGSSTGGALQYSAKGLRPIFLLGDAEWQSFLHHKLYSLAFLSFGQNQNLLDRSNGFHIVVAPVDFEDATSIQVCFRALERLKRTSAYVILISTNPNKLELTFDDLVFAASMEVRFVAMGESRFLDLRSHIKNMAFSDAGTSEIMKLEKELNLAMEEDRVGRVHNLFSKLHGLERGNKQNMSILHLLTRASSFLKDDARTHSYLSRLLTANPQDLWALVTFLKNSTADAAFKYKRENNYFKILYQTAQRERPRRTYYLKLLKDLSIAEPMIEYLIEVSRLHAKLKQYDFAWELLEWAIHAENQSRLLSAKAWHYAGRCQYHMGYLKRALECLNHSLELGGERYPDAAKSLAQIKKSLQQS